MTYVAKQKALGPVLLLDAGDALSKLAPESGESKPSEAERQKAALILQAMGRLGYAAMAVGERDLVLEPSELRKRASEAKVALLAANVVDAQGKKPFAERTLVKVDGIPVGVLAVTSGELFQRQGLKVLPALPAAQAQADALRKAGAKLVIALLHLPYDDALKVANGLKRVDYAIQSHDGRTSSAQMVGSVLLTGGGERGRQIGRAKFGVGTKGPVFDLSDAASARDDLASLEQTVVRTKEQIKANPSGRDQQEAMLKLLTRRREELLKRMDAKPLAGQSTAQTELVVMDSAFADDPEMKKLIEAHRAAHGDASKH